MFTDANVSGHSNSLDNDAPEAVLGQNCGAIGPTNVSRDAMAPFKKYDVSKYAVMQMSVFGLL
jgi:hypothetical protein